jgi:hypothetical protein
MLCWLGKQTALNWDSTAYCCGGHPISVVTLLHSRQCGSNATQAMSILDIVLLYNAVRARLLDCSAVLYDAVLSGTCTANYDEASHANATHAAPLYRTSTSFELPHMRHVTRTLTLGPSAAAAAQGCYHTSRRLPGP